MSQKLSFRRRNI